MVTGALWLSWNGSRLWGIILVVACAWGTGVVSCASAVEQRCSGYELAARHVEEVWQKNEEVVEAVIRGVGTEVGSEDFEEAIEFFEGLTGIMSDTGTYFGRFPTADLPHSLRKWRAWYEKNKAVLCWDPTKGLVRQVDSFSVAGAAFNPPPASPPPRPAP